MADNAARQEAVDALARQLVTDLSPAELPLFDATAARYHADPDATLEARSGGEDSLGFGVETAVVLLAPYAIDLVKRIFTRVAEKVGDSAADSLAAKITRLFGGAKKQEGPKEPDPLTPEQLAWVEETARDEAKQLKLPADRAEALANGVVAALATRT